MLDTYQRLSSAMQATKKRNHPLGVCLLPYAPTRLLEHAKKVAAPKSHRTGQRPPLFKLLHLLLHLLFYLLGTRFRENLRLSRQFRRRRLTHLNHYSGKWHVSPIEVLLHTRTGMLFLVTSTPVSFHFSCRDATALPASIIPTSHRHGILLHQPKMVLYARSSHSATRLLVLTTTVVVTRHATRHHLFPLWNRCRNTSARKTYAVPERISRVGQRSGEGTVVRAYRAA